MISYTDSLTFKNGANQVINMDSTGNVNINNSLNVFGNSSINGSVTISGNSSVTGNSSVMGNSSITGLQTIAGNTSIGGNLTVTGSSTICPIGTILMWTKGTPPTGYLLCNGQSLSTTGYSNLYSVIGYTFGGAVGNFNVPNYQNYMPIGAGNSYSLGNTGGSSTTALAIGNMPNHNHTLGSVSASSSFSNGATSSAGSHQHTVYGYTNGVGGGGDSQYSLLTNSNSSPAPNNNKSNGTDVQGSHSHSVTGSVSTSISGSTDSSGSGSSFSTISPYLAIYFIIKY